MKYNWGMITLFGFIPLVWVFITVMLFSSLLLNVVMHPKREEEMSEYERIRAKSPIGKLKPLLEAIVGITKKNRFLTSRMERNQKRWNKLLTNAGSPGNLTPEDFFALKQLVPLLTILFLLLFGVRHLGIYLILIALAYFLPDIWLNDGVKRRQKAIAHALPDALDIFTLMVSAGLDFGEAIDIHIQQSKKGILIEEFSLSRNEMKLGKSRAEALVGMASRIDYLPLSNFATAVVQAEKMGVSLAETLQKQSDDLRTSRFQLAEEMGHKAPVKMIFPMVFLIFPIIFVILFAPTALKYFIK